MTAKFKFNKLFSQTHSSKIYAKRAEDCFICPGICGVHIILTTVRKTKIYILMLNYSFVLTFSFVVVIAA